MIRFTTPLDLWTNALTASYIVAESNSVIAMRMMGMAGVWSVTPAENERMLSEKMQAVTQSLSDASHMALSGGRPDQITAAAMEPIRRKTRANSKRLAKRGLKTG